MRISAGLKGFSGKIMRNARARGLITAFPKARPNASLHYCGKSTRTCQNHVRPHPHQARPYQPNKGDARHGRGAPCRSWHLPALETYLHGSFLFFLPTPSNYLMKKNKTSKKFTTFNDEEKGRMVTLSYICRKSVYLSIR